METATAKIVHVLTTRRMVNLPFSVVLKDFKMAKANYLDNLDPECTNDPESLAITKEMADHAEAVWQVVLEDEALFQRFVISHILDDELLFKGTVLTAAARIGERSVRIFEDDEPDSTWDPYEFLRNMIISERPEI